MTLPTFYVILYLFLGCSTLNAQTKKQRFYKAIFLCTKKADLTQDAFMDYSIQTHVPLVLKIPNLRGYVVNFAKPEVNDPAYDAVVELWFDSEQDFMSGLQSSEGQAAVADQVNFLEGTPFFNGFEERTMIQPKRSETGAIDRNAYKATFITVRNKNYTYDEILMMQFRDYAPMAIGIFTPVFHGYEINFVTKEKENFPALMVIHAWFENKEAYLKIAQENPAVQTLVDLRNTYYSSLQSFDVIEYVALAPPTLAELD